MLQPSGCSPGGHRAISLCGLLSLLMVAGAMRPSAVCAEPSSDTRPFRDDSQHFALRLPADWVSAHLDEIAGLNRLAAERMPQARVNYIHGFHPRSGNLATFPYLLIQTIPMPMGQIAPEAIERELAKNFQSKVAELKGSVRDVARDIEFGTVMLDRSRWRFVFRTEADRGDGTKVASASFGFLGRDGIVMLHGYGAQSDFDALQREFLTVADSFTFDTGYGYAPRAAGGFDLQRVLFTGAVGGVVGGIAAGVYALLRGRAAGVSRETESRVPRDPAP